MDRVFLDANVIFSAAYKPGSRLCELWSLQGIELVISLYADEEARRNVRALCPGRIDGLEELLSGITLVSGLVGADLPNDIGLPDKDVPILLAAIGARCTHLLTGDVRHFGQLYGVAVHGVLIQTPAQYLLRSRP